MRSTPELHEGDGRWAKLRRRKVVQWGLAYAAAAWTLLQVIQFFGDTYSWPAAVRGLSGVALPLGLPFVVVVAWFHGDRGNQKVSRLEAGALIVLAVAAGSALWAFASRLDESDWTSPGASPQAGFVASDAASIAVLPFANLTADASQDYFSDGMSEEVLNLLAQLPQLRVIARTSSFSFKDKNVDIATIARTLNVANVLEGSVRRSGDTVRISVQLIRASDSSQLWSQTFDRKLNDVFEVQDDIAGAVVAALKVRLQAGQRVTNPHRTENPDAYNAYLHGAELFSQMTPDSFTGSVAAFRQAIALDPGFAPAYARLATAEYIAADYVDTATAIDAGRRRGLEAADRAIALAPDLAIGYMARGFIRMIWLFDWDGARADLERAVLLEPGNAEIQRTYGELLGSLGRTSEALAAFNRAIELDPLSSGTWYDLGWANMATGEWQQARAALTRALQIYPDSSFVNYTVGKLELLQGRTAQALEHFGRTDSFWSAAGEAMAQHSLGDEDRSQRALSGLVATYGRSAAFQIAEVYAWRGERDQAFEWLDRAREQRDGGLCMIKVEPFLATLRSDPRFAEMLKALGLPP